MAKATAKAAKPQQTAKGGKKPGRKIINVALQGGGAHGAFTWGVLDALLADDRIDIEGVSGTSAGAMNAAIMVQGLDTGGTARAREMLEEFWTQISQAGAYYTPAKNTLTQWANLMNPFRSAMVKADESAMFGIFETMARYMSPYQFNPMNINPLRDILANALDIPQLQNAKSVKLFITSTCVRTGIGRVFENKEITVDTLLASATLPEMFQAVKIGDDYYWDGGYSGNPALYPLFYAAETTDILIVHVNPIVRQEIPRSATAIDNRLNEITFNGALLDELRAIAFAKRLVTEGWLKDEYKGRLKNILIHAIRADEVLKDLSVASKMDTDWDFLISLRDLGRTEGKNWIDRNYDAINERDTVDIRRDYLDLDAGG
jgi:NTE family protein